LHHHARVFKLIKSGTKPNLDLNATLKHLELGLTAHKADRLDLNIARFCLRNWGHTASRGGFRQPLSSE